MTVQTSTPLLLKCSTGDAHSQQVGVCAPLHRFPIEIFSSLTEDMERVESRIRNLFSSDALALTEISEYLFGLGGKRIRPALTLLVARLVGVHRASAQLIDIAAGIELIHMATLLHDDIIDESPTRRRQASAFQRFGLGPTLLAGDFLLVRAFGLCAHLGDYVVEATERACIALTEGEILEGRLAPSRDIALKDYLDIIGKKTASLFALAAETGAYVAGAGPQTTALLREFGYETGIAFQMVDDILDIVGDEDLLGKPVGTDLRQQTPSIINVLWLKSGEEAAREFFSKPEPSLEECRAAALHLAASPVVAECRSLAAEYAARAQRTLAQVGSDIRSEETFEQLRALIDFTVNRCL